MIKYGIKLWSPDKSYFPEAVDLCHKDLIDFVELYILPNTFPKKYLDILKNIPTQVHAPHSLHGFNVFELDKEKINLFKNQAVKVADFFNSQYIILHAGMGRDRKIFKRNIKKIYDKRILIENKPKIGLNNQICFGYSLPQLKFIKNQCRVNNICLDIGHAIKSAVSQRKDYKKYLETLIKALEPNYFHISDGLLSSEKDEHLDLGRGDFDLKWIKNQINQSANKHTVYLVFETPKKNNDLRNDIKNVIGFKNL